MMGFAETNKTISTTSLWKTKVVMKWSLTSCAVMNQNQEKSVVLVESTVY